MSQAIHTISRKRAIYEQLRAAMGPNVKITWTVLGRLLLIKNNKLTYEFSFRSQDQSVEDPELLLPLEDVHVAIEAKMTLVKKPDAKKGAFIPQTYPNPAVFGENQALDMRNFYNGRMYARVDQDIEFDNIVTQQFLHIPEVQQRGEYLARNAADDNNVGGAPEVTFSQWKFSDGMIDLEPLFVMNGMRKNLIGVSVPAFEGSPVWESTPTNDHYLFVQLPGFTVSSGARQHYDMIRDSLAGI